MPRAPKQRSRLSICSTRVCSGGWKLGLRITDFARFINSGFALRASLEPLDPSSGDRRVRTGAPPRSDRPIMRRRARRPRAWGEARGPRTSQSLPLRSLKRARA
jgi:hypothetical protein